MKLRIKLFFTFLLLCGFTHAQVTKESFEKAIDLLNCKTVEFSLKDEDSLPDFLEKCPCGETSYPQINDFLISVGKLDATIALSIEIDSLKNSFKETSTKDEIILLWTEAMFRDQINFEKIFVFANKRKGKIEFDTYKAKLKTDLKDMLVEIIPKENVAITNAHVPTQTLDDRISALEIKQKEEISKSWFSRITSQILVVSILVSLLFTFLTLLFTSKLFKDNDREVSSEIRDYLKRKIDEVSLIRNPSNNNFNSSELKDANYRIRDLESQIEKIINQLNTVTPSSSSMTQPTYQEVKQPEVKTETFYLTSPNSDGNFDESSASLMYKEGATIYRFTKIGNNKSQFQIDDKEASIILALQYRDRRIDPVCESVNAFNQATRISTVEQGEAELFGGKWMVIKKAKIRYEN